MDYVGNYWMETGSVGRVEKRNWGAKCRWRSAGMWESWLGGAVAGQAWTIWTCLIGDEVAMECGGRRSLVPAARFWGQDCETGWRDRGTREVWAGESCRRLRGLASPPRTTRCLWFTNTWNRCWKSGHRDSWNLEPFIYLSSELGTNHPSSPRHL